MKKLIKELRTFIVLWSTQSLSQLGSAMTNFALTLWLYEQTGSALRTALLSICSYAPYVCVSIVAGAFSDRWDKKKVMLVCDAFAAGCTVTVLVLMKNHLLMPWHLYVLNAVNGLMNTIQQPASDVAMTLIVPEKHYQRTSGLRSFSNSLVTILPAPKKRVRVIYITMLISMGSENFLLAFSGTPFLWCLGQIIGWLLVPVMNANLDVILRTTIPVEMQGRVYSCRNTLQFFTIPIGYLLAGYMIDEICEPIMKSVSSDSMLECLFGSGKGAGAAVFLFILGVAGTAICLIFGKILRKYEM